MNEIKKEPEGSKKGTINSTMEEKPNQALKVLEGCCVLEVRDYGIYVDGEDIDKIFKEHFKEYEYQKKIVRLRIEIEPLDGIKEI